MIEKILPNSGQQILHDKLTKKFQLYRSKEKNLEVTENCIRGS
jgi:hypothetical protein